MSKKSKYDEVRQVIDDYRAAGATVQQIHRGLLERGFDSRYRSLWGYIQRMDNPEIRPAPHCRECNYLLKAKSAIKKGGHTYICLDAVREISMNSSTSPMWCPKRDKALAEMGE